MSETTDTQDTAQEIGKAAEMKGKLATLLGERANKEVVLTQLVGEVLLEIRITLWKVKRHRMDVMPRLINRRTPMRRARRRRFCRAIEPLEKGERGHARRAAIVVLLCHSDKVPPGAGLACAHVSGEAI